LSAWMIPPQQVLVVVTEVAAAVAGVLSKHCFQVSRKNNNCLLENRNNSRLLKEGWVTIKPIPLIV
jgi:hypothetical protein